MNAETRAKEVMAWLRQECSDSICTHLDCPSCGCMAYLAQALHQAQNDKLEEAARIYDTKIEDGCIYTACTIASDLRSLKSKD